VLLSARGAGGHWGRGFYQPEWISSHYVLLELKNMGLSRDTPEARETLGDGTDGPTGTGDWPFPGVQRLAQCGVRRWVMTSSPVRTLRRSRSNRVVGGVCGGIGQYLGVDPVLLRIAAVALALASGVGVVAYVIAWIAMPDNLEEPETVRAPATPGAVAVVAGGVLVAVGGVLLIRQLVPWFEMGVVWPVVVIVAGLLVLVTGLGRRQR